MPKYIRIFEEFIFEEVTAHAASIQQFLKDNGFSDLAVDSSFGPLTATAAAQYLAQYNKSWEGITTVDGLRTKMIEFDWDPGEEAGFGPKMANELAALLNKIKPEVDKIKANKGQKEAVVTLMNGNKYYGILFEQLIASGITLKLSEAKHVNHPFLYWGPWTIYGDAPRKKLGYDVGYFKKTQGLEINWTFKWSDPTGKIDNGYAGRSLDTQYVKNEPTEQVKKFIDLMKKPEPLTTL